MKKNMIIGLMGAITDNANLGCVALTYSVIKALQSACDKNGIYATYIIFEDSHKPEKVQRMCEELGIEPRNMEWVAIGYIHKWTSIIKYAPRNLKMVQGIKQCDFVVDLTQGDSFADIYGKERFMIYTKIKELVEKLQVPLILGPQTYGPFNEEKNKSYAKKVIEHAYKVISRDQESADYIASFSDKNVEVTTDLAFLLPYTIGDKKDNTKIKIGINISSLLIKDKIERTETKFKLKTDYDKYINSLLEELSKDEKYEIYLIPHVGDDAGKVFSVNYPNVILQERFTTPVEAKSFIASMDIFIGARMHATIAAFSSGVATIPTAYSRKFSGLYNNLGYDCVVDMQKLTTEQALELTIQYVKDYQKLIEKRNVSINKINSKSERTIEIFEEILRGVK